MELILQQSCTKLLKKPTILKPSSELLAACFTHYCRWLICVLTITHFSEHAFYLNFEGPRLFDLDRNDFSRLDDIIADRGSRALYFDEIQVLDGWERCVRQKLEDGFQLVITGSNASLLSRELGTKTAEVLPCHHFFDE